MINEYNVLRGINELIDTSVYGDDIDVKLIEKEMVKQGFIADNTPRRTPSMSKHISMLFEDVGLDPETMLPRDIQSTSKPAGSVLSAATIRDNVDEPVPPQPPAPTSIQNFTNEQIFRKQVDNAFGGGDTNTSFSDVKKEQEIYLLLAQIEEYKEEICASGCELKGVAEHTINDNIKDIRNTLGMLRRRLDVIRYTDISGELMTLAAKFIERIFNGKRVFLGKYKPDLTGWSKSIQPRIRRCKPEASEAVSGVLEEYELGFMMRVALELLPSAFTYTPETQKRAALSHKPRGTPTDIAKLAERVKSLK